MMEDTKSGIGVIGVLFVILVIWAIFGGGFGCNNGGFGWGNSRCGNGQYVPYMPDNGCTRVSNCEIERSGLINTATTQFLVEQNGAATRTELHNTQDAIMAQASRIYEAQQSETIFDLKMENQALKGQLYSDAKFNALEKQISDCCCGINQRFASIECNMLTKPNLSGVASTCNGQLIPAPWGNYGCNGNRNI